MDRPDIAGAPAATARLLTHLRADEIVEDCEDLRRALGLELGLLHFTWLLPGIAVLVAVLVYLVPLARALEHHERVVLLRAAAVYVCGAVVLEMVGGLVVDVDVQVDGYTLPYLAVTTLEEGLELIGAVMLVGALLHVAGRRGPHLLFGVATDPDGGEYIAIRSMCYLALSYDHRLVDGADASRYPMAVKKRIEDADFESEVGL